MGDQKLSIPFAKLNNSNYSIWKYKMELYLIKEGVWETIAEDESDDDENTDDDTSTSTTMSAKGLKKLKKLDNKARALIGLMVEDDQLPYIRNEITALGSWNALKEHYEKHTLSNKVHLIRSICSLKLEENGDVEKHISRMSGLFQKLRDINEKKLCESWNVAMLLSSLPKQYDTLITALEARQEKDLTYAFVQGKILAEYERRIKGQSKGSQFGNAMVATSNAFLCHFCKKEGHFKKDCERYKLWLAKQEEKQREANISYKYEENESCGL